MLSCITMIMAGGRGQRLHPLSRDRAKPAIRFGGMYRIIDFTMSNCLNSGIRQIYILTQYASSSLERYLRNGWLYLFRTGLDEFIETRPPQQYGGREWYEGTADCIYKNLNIIEKSGSKYTLILSGDHVYKMDYRKLLEEHWSNKADVSIACIKVPVELASQFGVIHVFPGGKIKSFIEKPENPPALPDDPASALCNMGVYCFTTDFLVQTLKEYYQNHESGYDFGKDIIPHLIENNSSVYAHTFVDENKKDEPYWRDIGTLDAYYDANMDLVAVDPLFNLYDMEWPVRNFNRQLPPAKTVFNNHEENRIGSAYDSLISPGVILSGAYVERSILSPEVVVHSFASVTNSILFDKVEVKRGAVVRNAIIDRQITVEEGDSIGVDLEKDAQRFTVTNHGRVIVA